jgi:hypothetical protein
VVDRRRARPATLIEDGSSRLEVASEGERLERGVDSQCDAVRPMGGRGEGDRDGMIRRRVERMLADLIWAS